MFRCSLFSLEEPTRKLQWISWGAGGSGERGGLNSGARQNIAAATSPSTAFCPKQGHFTGLPGLWRSRGKFCELVSVRIDCKLPPCHNCLGMIYNWPKDGSEWLLMFSSLIMFWAFCFEITWELQKNHKDSTKSVTYPSPNVSIANSCGTFSKTEKVTSVQILFTFQ